MNHQLLIIGNTLEFFQLGACFVRAAQSMNLPTLESDTSWKTYAPSMSHWWGRAFFKLSGKRTLEWWEYNQRIISLIEQCCPQVVLVTGIFPMRDEVFQTCNKLDAKIVNYLTDNPWNPQNYCSGFIANLPNYDYIFSTKKAIIPDLLNAKVKEIHFLPFAFDPFLHRQVFREGFEVEHLGVPEVCLIGGADSERINFIKEFLSHFKGHLGLYGDYWYKDKNLKQFNQGVVLGDAFCRVVHKCKINLGVVRRANRDGHSMRSYEIPACGGVGIYEDTSEHRELFQGYPEYGFFTSPEDLADKCNWLLEHPVEREQMRQLGIQLIVTEANTYAARFKTIVERFNFELSPEMEG
jgi:hypothetical protein